MKNFKALALTLTSILVANASGQLPSMAQGTGVVDSASLLEQYPEFINTQNQVAGLDKKLAEYGAELTRQIQPDLENKSLSDEQKNQKRTDAQTKYAARKKEYETQAEKMMEAVMNKVYAAVEQEAKAQALDIVVSKNATLFGGKDITPQVLARLKK